MLICCQPENDAAIGARWRKDSSLESWFPITAESIDRTKVFLLGVHSEAQKHLAENDWATGDIGDMQSQVLLRDVSAKALSLLGVSPSNQT